MPSIRRVCSTRCFKASFLLLAALVSLGSQVTFCGTDQDPFQDRLGLANPRFAPQWSADGESIVFTFGDWQRGSTYIAKPDGSSVRLVSASSGREEEIDFGPDISPDDSRIIYATTRHRNRESAGCRGRYFDIEISNLDGSDRRRLTETAWWDVSPAWSPDGATIAFARTETCYRAPGGDHGIFSIRPDGSGLRMISPFAESSIIDMDDDLSYGEKFYYQSGPVWSPDGQALAFVAQVEATPDVEWTSSNYRHEDILYVVGADGAGLRRLFSTDNSDVDAILGTPAWSPDGLNIAFVTYLASNHQEWLQFLAETSASGYSATQYHGDVPLGLTLYTVGSNGSGLRELAYFGEGPSDTLYSGYFPYSGNLRRYNPALESYNPRLEWSHDADTILLSDSQSVYLINTDRSGVRSHIAGAYGSWSPDNSRIAITTVREPEQDYSDEGSDIVLFTTAQDGSDRRILVRAGADDLIAENPTRRWWSWIPFFG